MPESAIRAQLEEILASDTFARAERLSRFLRFVVEQTLGGHAAGLKEQVLACELYGKRTDFDAARDAVVRVDARRLRDKLREYYADAPEDPVLIDLPKGAYVPTFDWSANAVATAAQPVQSSAQPQQSAVRSPRKKLKWAALPLAAALVWIGVVASRALPKARYDAPKLLPLTAYPGDESWPSLSPDGNFVAFTCSSPENPISPDICVKEVGTEAMQRLVATPAVEHFPAWSPDGRQLAFARGRGTKESGIFVISRVGGPERKIAESGTIVAWTPDGKSLLIRARSQDEPFGIRQVYLDTLHQRQVTEPRTGAGDWSFDISPDGKTLAFVRYERPGVSDLYVMPMDGGEPRRLTDWSSNIGGPAWMPNGKELVYAANERLWRISLASAKRGRGSPIPDIPVRAGHVSISRSTSGRTFRLAFHSPQEQISMRRIELDSVTAAGTFQNITSIAPATRADVPGRFSTDGSRIAFTSTRGSSDFELWIADREGAKLRQLTFFGSTRGMLAHSWSPDGQRILFDTSIAGNNDLYSVSPDGGQPLRLTTANSIEGLADWSADGQWVYYTIIRSPSDFDIWRIPSQGGHAERVTKTGGSEPQLSPDGQYLYYVDQPPVRASISARLLRIRVLGGDPEVVHKDVSPSYWAVTEKGIFFLQEEGRGHAIHLFRFTDDKTVRVGSLPFRVAHMQAPGRLTVSRDGRWALVNVVDRREGDLMLIDNFR